MKLRRSVGLSWRALIAHRMRAGLALGSVSAGVAAVVLTSALGRGAQQAVQARIQGMGSNLLVVRPGRTPTLVAREGVKGFVTTLRLDDAADVEALDVVAAVAPDVEGPVRVKRGGIVTRTKVVGTTAAFRTVRNFSLRAGRFLTAEDDRTAARVTVLGARVADALFSDGGAVGHEVRVGGVPFDVVGVLAAKGVQADGDEDNQVVVPVRTALRRVFNTTALSAIFLSVADEREMSKAEAAIAVVMRIRHRIGDGRPDDFEVQNAARMFALQQRAAESLNLLATGLAGLALSVGGTGILALMLMSVKERTTEIGLRIAVGATPRDILIQFLSEATLLAVAGWLVGVGLAGIAAVSMAAATRWSVGMPLDAVLASLAMVLTIGVGFGALPARKASLVPPIEALLST